MYYKNVKLLFINYTLICIEPNVLIFFQRTAAKVSFLKTEVKKN